MSNNARAPVLAIDLPRQSSRNGGPQQGPPLRENSTIAPLQSMSSLDRFCERILDWNIVDNIGMDGSTKGEISGVGPGSVPKCQSLPLIYTTYHQYLNAWEPVMIEELKASVVSNLPGVLRSNINPAGPAFFTLSENGSDRDLLPFEVDFDAPVADQDPDILRMKGGRDKTPQKADVQKMDLLIISTEPLDIFASDSSAASKGRIVQTAKLRQQKYVLGLVVSGGTGGGMYRKGAQEVFIHRNSWIGYRSHLSKEYIVPYYKSAKTKRSTTTAHMLAGNTKTVSYKLHYTLLSRLRSNWREFLALYDLVYNKSLLSTILGSNRQITMATTPPQAYNRSASGSSFVHGAEDFQDLEFSVSGASSAREDNFGAFSPTSSTTAAVPTAAAPAPAAATTTMAGGNVCNAIQENNDKLGLNRAAVAISSTTKSSGTFDNVTMRDEVTQNASWKMKGVTEKFIKYIRLKYNPSQEHAIHKAVEQSGFTLVQGPPGTGKTSTILGILNAIHIREYNQYYQRAIASILGPEGQQCRSQSAELPWLQLAGSFSHSKPRVLVVAPSNIAVDNIVQRVMEHGFVDGNGGQYFPNIVRMGAGCKSEIVKAVSLSALVNAQTKQLFDPVARRDESLQLQGRISSLIRDIAFHQGLLLNLSTAFQLHGSELPNGVEIRVDTKTGAPYFVDHVLRTTAPTPPPPSLLLERGRSNVHTSAEMLPEHKQFSHSLTQIVGLFEKAVKRQNQLLNVTHRKESSRNTDIHGMLEEAVIQNAEIIFTTLNGAGHPSLESTDFCVTVVDEAAQSVEPEVLIALRRGCRQCIMVGDQEQLPATVFSEETRAAGYDRSLFQRLIESGHPYMMLDTQYRMSPAISAYPSKVFYKHKLLDGENVKKVDFLPPFIRSSTCFNSSSNNNFNNSDNSGLSSTSGSGHVRDEEEKKLSHHSLSADAIMAPRVEGLSSQSAAEVEPDSTAVLQSFMVFNLQKSGEIHGEQSSSQSNVEEAKLCMLLIHTVVQAAQQCNSKGVNSVGSVGIITPYADQVQLLRNLVRNEHFPIRMSHEKHSSANPHNSSDSSALPMIDGRIDVDSVDGYQGKEKDIIIISTVRSNDQGRIGFVKDPRRLNVAITRAKRGLYVVGNADTLRSNQLWDGLIQYAYKQQAVVNVPHAEVNLFQLLQGHSGVGTVQPPQNSSGETTVYNNGDEYDDARNDADHQKNGSTGTSSSALAFMGLGHSGSTGATGVTAGMSFAASMKALYGSAVSSNRNTNEKINRNDHVDAKASSSTATAGGKRKFVEILPSVATTTREEVMEDGEIEE